MREPVVDRIAKYADMILDNEAKGCPDPVGGGCMGHYCNVCAVRAIQGALREVDERIEQLKRLRGG